MRYRAAVLKVVPFLVAATAFGQFPSPTLTESTTKVSEHVFMTPGFPNVVYVVGGNERRWSWIPGSATTMALWLRASPNDCRRARSCFSRQLTIIRNTRPASAGFRLRQCSFAPPSNSRSWKKKATQTMTFFRNSPQFGPSLQGLGPLRPPDMTFDTEAKLDLAEGLRCVSCFWVQDTRRAMS